MLKNKTNKIKYHCILLFYFFLLVINLIEKIQILKKEEKKKFQKKRHLSFENSGLKIIHFILTRFAVGFFRSNNDSTKDYTINGIRVMKKYLLPSLENQSCKDFIWILMLGKNLI